MNEWVSSIMQCTAGVSMNIVSAFCEFLKHQQSKFVARCVGFFYPWFQIHKHNSRIYTMWTMRTCANYFYLNNTSMREWLDLDQLLYEHTIQSMYKKKSMGSVRDRSWIGFFFGSVFIVVVICCHSFVWCWFFDLVYTRCGSAK